MAIFVWYPKEREDLKTIHGENDVLTDDELVIARNFRKKPKHGSLILDRSMLLVYASAYTHRCNF